MHNITSDFSHFGIVDKEDNGSIILGYCVGTPNRIPTPIKPVCRSLGIRLTDLPKECLIGNFPIIPNCEEIHYYDRLGRSCFITTTDRQGSHPVGGFYKEGGIARYRTWTKTGHSSSYKTPASTDLCR